MWPTCTEASSRARGSNDLSFGYGHAFGKANSQSARVQGLITPESLALSGPINAEIARRALHATRSS